MNTASESVAAESTPTAVVEAEEGSTPTAVVEAEEGSTPTRVRLLDAVIKIASSYGLDKVTYRSVASEAGLSHGLVRFYFGSKEGMVSQALEHAARLDVAESRIVAESIDSFSSEFVRTVSSEQSRGLLQYDFLLRAVRGGVPAKDVVALYDFYIEQVSETLRNVHIQDEDGSFAALILAAVDGLVLQHSIYGSAERTENILERLRDVLRMLQERGVR